MCQSFLNYLNQILKAKPFTNGSVAKWKQNLLFICTNHFEFLIVFLIPFEHKYVGVILNRKQNNQPCCKFAFAGCVFGSSLSTTVTLFDVTKQTVKWHSCIFFRCIIASPSIFDITYRENSGDVSLVIVIPWYLYDETMIVN